MDHGALDLDELHRRVLDELRCEQNRHPSQRRSQATDADLRWVLARAESPSWRVDVDAGTAGVVGTWVASEVASAALRLVDALDPVPSAMDLETLRRAAVAGLRHELGLRPVDRGTGMDDRSLTEALRRLDHITEWPLRFRDAHRTLLPEWNRDDVLTHQLRALAVHAERALHAPRPA